MKKAERNCLYLKDGEEVHIGDILVKGDKLYVVDEEIIPLSSISYNMVLKAI